MLHLKRGSQIAPYMSGPDGPDTFSLKRYDSIVNRQGWTPQIS